MIITQASLEALRTGFRTEFNSGIATAAPKYGAITTTVPSSTKVETYGFLADFPIFKKWVGPKKIRSMAERAYQLANDDFEATLGIHKHKIEDDNLGLYGPIVKGWGEQAGTLADRLAFEALGLGHQRPCFDGQNFFDDEHVIGPDEEAFSNSTGNDAVAPWFMLDCSKPLKPILHQERKKPAFTMVTDPQDSHVFKTGEYLMGGEARGAAGYTWWQLGHRCTSTLNKANYEAVRNSTLGLVNDEGEPLGVKFTHLVVGQSNVAAARDLIEKANLAGGESNIWFKDVTVIEAERLP